MAVKKRGFYSPWGYQEENDYQSSETQFEVELNELFASASYNKDDKKIHFFNNDGKDISGSSIDTTQFAGGSVIKDATYDPETKILTIEFENGDKVEINFAELVDETEFGDGLQVVDSVVSILIDESGEPYLSVGENGLKIVGINQAIADALADEKARAEQAESDLQAAIEAEGQRAEDAEAALDAKVDQEIADREADVDAEETRAKAAEDALDAKIDQEIQDRKDDVDAEETRAKAEEAAANRRIDTLNDALDGEKTIREAADVRLENLITAEKNRAEAAESALDAKIDQEIADRIADVDAEEARAISAETELGNALDLLNQKLGYKDNETLQKNGEHEVAFGSYNISNTGATPADRTIFSIGNGTADDARSNALEVRENGDVYMWIENDYLQINRLLAMLAHEVYDDDDNSNG
jgi:hypothetical protein